MALQMILGGSGSGKSQRLFEMVIAQSMADPRGSYIVIVPEQFTMQTQRRLVMMHPRGGILNIDVLPLKRLALRVFEETGVLMGEVLTETGKDLLIRSAASRIKDSLHVFGTRLDQPGMIAQIRSILSEFEQYEIGEGELSEMIAMAQSRPLLQRKLQDLLKIRRACLKEQGGAWVTGESLMERLADAAVRSTLVASSHLFFDGFTGFTPVQMTAMETLLKTAKDVTLTLTIDPKEALTGRVTDHELFALSKRTIRALSDMAVRARVPIASPILLTQEKGRFRAGGPLAGLEEGLFRYRGSSKPRVARMGAGAKGDCVRLIGCADPSHEAQECAKQILHLVRGQGLRYREIAVILGDVPTYERHLRRAFGTCGIPCFFDQTRAVLQNPCLELIRSAIAAAQDGMSYESMLRMLRCGFFGLSEDETDRLENYVLAFGVRGIRRWTSVWDRTNPFFDETKAATCEELRARVMERYGTFCQEMTAPQLTAGRAVDALIRFLEKLQIREALSALAERFSDEGDRQRAMEYEQLFDLISALLSQIQSLLGDQPVTLREFSGLLEAGFSELSVGIIPPGTDEIHIGDMERTRLDEVQVLFFLGVNDGYIPQASGDRGLVTGFDRGFLKEQGIALAPDAREKAFLQRFYLYLTLTKPSAYLTLLFSRSSCDGAAKDPSYLIREVSALTGAQPVKKEPGEDGIRDILTPAQMLPAYARSLNEGERALSDGAFQALEETVRQDPDTREMAQKLRDAGAVTARFPVLGEELARALYGSHPSTSVTRLETFAGCPFAHFASFGLRLRERDRFEIRALDLGNVVHDALAFYARSISEQGLSWTQMEEDAQQRLIAHCVSRVISQYAPHLFSDSARNTAAAQRFARIVSRSVKALTGQLAMGTFLPETFETAFDEHSCPGAMRIGSGQVWGMGLRGRIDRTDLGRDNEKMYLKILDYKTGNTKLEPTPFYYGLQLQLAVYLMAAQEMLTAAHPGSEVVPAAMLYTPIADPIIEAAPQMAQPELEMAWLRALRPNGLVNADPKVLAMLDRKTETGESPVIPVTYKSSGIRVLTKRSKAVTGEQFQLLTQFTSRKLEELGRRVMAGELRPLPYRRRDRTACDYCSYRDVCGFDRRIGAYHMRSLKELSWEQIFDEQRMDITAKERH